MKDHAKSSAGHGELGQVGRFGLVGILNTVVDFVVLNILAVTLLPKSLVLASFTLAGQNVVVTGLIVAGLISGTVAMINSYFFNLRFTFKSRHVTSRHTVYFFIITIFGLYVIRPVLFKIFTDVWQWPVSFAFMITQALHVPLSQDFVQRNLVLAITILVVLVYNYLMYKYFVFNKEKPA